MQKRTVRVCAFRFEVRKKVAPHLAWPRDTDDAGVCDLLAGSQSKITLHPGRRPPVRHFALGQRVLNPQKDISGYDRRTLHRPAHASPGELQVDQLHFADGDVARIRADLKHLSQIGSAVQQDNRPDDAQIAVAALERELERLAAQRIGQPRCPGARNQLTPDRLARELQVARIVNRSILQQNGEGLRQVNLRPKHARPNGQTVQFARRRGPIRTNSPILNTKLRSMACRHSAPALPVAGRRCSRDGHTPQHQRCERLANHAPNGLHHPRFSCFVHLSPLVLRLTSL